MKSLPYCCFLLLLVPGFTHASFTDVSQSHPQYNAIEWAQTEGIVSGYEDGSFKPNDTINRAEFLKILLTSQYGTETIEYVQFFDNHGFTDVPENVWYYRYTLFAWQLNIIGGYPDKTFRPSNNVNLAEAAKIITELQSNKEIEPIGTNWYEKYIQYLENHNAIPANQNPSYFITRGDMVEILYKIKLYAVENASTSLERTVRIHEAKLSFSYPDLWQDVKRSIIDNDLIYYDFPIYANSPIIELIDITDRKKEVCILPNCMKMSTNDIMTDITSNPDVTIAGIPMRIIDNYSSEGGVFVRRYIFFRNNYAVIIFQFFDFPAELERRYYHEETSLWDAYKTMMGSDDTTDAIHRVLQKFPDETGKLKNELKLLEDFMSTIVVE